MRKNHPFILLTALLIVISLGVSAAEAKSGSSSSSKPRVKDDARYILRHTASLIQQAKVSTRYHKNSRVAMKDYYPPTDPGRQIFGLEKAIEMQERAKDYYVQGMYQLSIDFSLDARIIAVRVTSDARQEKSRTDNRKGREKNREIQFNNTLQSAIDPREVRYWENHQSNLLLDQEIDGLGFKENETVPRFMEYNF